MIPVTSSEGDKQLEPEKESMCGVWRLAIPCTLDWVVREGPQTETQGLREEPELGEQHVQRSWDSKHLSPWGTVRR